MGLMLARVAHQLDAPGITMGMTAIGVAGAAAALTITGQYGLERDFSRPAPPSGDALGLGAILGGVGLVAGGSFAAWGDTAGERAFGRATLAATVGALTGVFILAPAIRRTLADD